MSKTIIKVLKAAKERLLCDSIGKSLKRHFALFLLLALGAGAAFSAPSRFHKANGELLDTMYVDSVDGLRVRDKAGLSGKKVCGLIHRLPVKVVSLGKEEVIDGIRAPWVEVVLPYWEWKGYKPEYGWVFGGYLAKDRPSFKVPSNANELDLYLKSFSWQCDNGVYYVDFGRNNSYGGEWGWKSYKEGRFTAVSANGFEVRYTDGSTEAFRVSQITENTCVINGSSFTGSSFGYPTEGSNYKNKMNLYNINKEGNNALGGWVIAHDKYDDEINYAINTLISYGVSAENTQFEKRYHDYWDPIVRQHGNPVPSKTGGKASRTVRADEYYNDGLVHDTLYIDSEKGVNVHAKPSAGSPSICLVPHGFPVKVVDVGKMDVIGDCEAPWIEILVPRYAWKTNEPEYGWIFADCVSAHAIPYEPKQNTEAELRNHLVSYCWKFYSPPGLDYSDSILFFEDGKGAAFYSDYDPKKKDYTEGYSLFDYEVVSGNRIRINVYKTENRCSFLAFCDSGTITVEISSSSQGYINFNGACYYCGYGFQLNPIMEELSGKNPFKHKSFYSSQSGNNIIRFMENFSEDQQVLDEAIRSGVSAKGTKYERRYHDYWNSIVKEHHKKNLQQ